MACQGAGAVLVAIPATKCAECHGCGIAAELPPRVFMNCVVCRGTGWAGLQ